MHFKVTSKYLKYISSVFEFYFEHLTRRMHMIEQSTWIFAFISQILKRVFFQIDFMASSSYFLKIIAPNWASHKCCIINVITNTL